MEGYALINEFLKEGIFKREDSIIISKKELKEFLRGRDKYLTNKRKRLSTEGDTLVHYSEKEDN
jgi:hypothetical protein